VASYCAPIQKTDRCLFVEDKYKYLRVWLSYKIIIQDYGLWKKQFPFWAVLGRIGHRKAELGIFGMIWGESGGIWNL